MRHNLIKKIFLIILGVILVVALAGCSPDSPTPIEPHTPPTPPTPPAPAVGANEVKIYYLNDIHGVLDNDTNLGALNVFSFLKEQKTLAPDNTFIFFGGDIFQGQFVSNHFYGEPMIDLMNYVGVDGLVLGNHEFDWGIDKILNYFDGDDANGEATFPLITNNITKKADGTRLEYTTDYQIFSYNDFDFSVIGSIGEGLESSILTSRVSDYEFGNVAINNERVYNEINNTIPTLDYNVFITHHGSTEDLYDYRSYISAAANLEKTGLYFEAHTHRTYIKDIQGMKVVQAGSNLSRVNESILTFDNNKVVTNVETRNLSSINSLAYTNEIENILRPYNEIAIPLLSEVIGTSAMTYNQYELTEYAARVFAAVTNSQVGIHNIGGTRTIMQQGVITTGNIYTIFPFDNVVIRIRIQGLYLQTLMNSGSYIAYNMGGYINDASYYYVALNDYIFESPYNNLTGYEFETFNTIKELMIDQIRKQQAQYGIFDIDNPIIL